MASSAGGGPVVVLHGINDVARALRQVESGMQREIRQAFLPISERVARVAAAEIHSQTGETAGKVTGRATQRSASVVGPVEWMGWLEFGGSVGRNHAVKREWNPDGRYIYPTARRMQPEIVDDVEIAIGRLIERAGLGG